MRIIRFIVVSALVAAFSISSTTGAEKIRVLLLTGNNNHDFKTSTPFVKKILEESGKFTVIETVPPKGMTADELAKFDVIVSNWNSWKNTKNAEGWPDEVKQAYLDFVKNGKGHVNVHAGGSSFYKGWDEYRKVVLMFWEKGKTGHGRQHEFTVNIDDKTHPVTAGIKDFNIFEELWEKPGVVEDARAIASAEHATKKDGKKHPVIIVGQYGKGRCLATTLGHGVKNMANDGFKQVLLRGTEWAATGKVSDGAAAATETAGDVVRLPAGDGLDGWKGNTGDWTTAGEVAQDSKNPKALVWKEGTGCLVNGKRGRTKHLVTEHQHGDVEVHVEFMVPKGSNSGVYFQGRYEVQVLDSWGKKEVKHGDCGGIYQRWHKGKGFEGHPPRVNASLEPGKWQTFDVIFKAPRFDDNGKKTANAVFVKVVHNGKVVHENVEVTGPTRAAMFNDEKPLGPIMFQGDHGPVAYRNITIKALK